MVVGWVVWGGGWVGVGWWCEYVGGVVVMGGG